MPGDLASLFVSHATLRPVIDAVLEGRLGRARCDPPEAPRLARLDLGCYAIFGGDAAHPLADEWMHEVAPPREILLPDNQAWRDLAWAVHGRSLDDRPMRTFSPHALDRETLQRLAAEPPAGFEVRRLDLALASRLDDALRPHALQVYESAEAFIADGVGFAATCDGRLACTATSYARSTRAVEIAIATHPDFRQLGLARIVAARLILHCLDLGLRPEWSAANPVSKRLALGLGYRPAALCDVFYLDR